MFKNSKNSYFYSKKVIKMEEEYEEDDMPEDEDDEDFSDEEDSD